jgi:hypothetical protein
LVVLLALCFPSVASVRTGPTDGCETWQQSETCVETGDDGIVITVGTGGEDGDGTGGGTGTDPSFEYRWVLACSTNTVDGTPTTCPGAMTSCPEPNNARYWVFRRPLSPAGAPASNWERMPGSLCRPIGTNGAPVITAGDIAGAFDWAFVPIRPSHTHFNPADGTLVNVETIFYADTPKTFRTTVTLLGQQVALTLHPTKWRWSFGDGTTLTTTTAGAPYPSKKVTHRYTDTGNRRASVTVTWDGTFTFAGATEAIPGDTSRPGPAATVAVREAHAQLVGGDS